MQTSALAGKGLWPPYALYPSAPEQGRREPELLELRRAPGAADWWAAFERGAYEVVQVWPIDAVVKNFLVAIAALLQEAEDQKRTSLTDGDVTDWINRTRRLADDLPYGGPVAGELRGLADRVASIRDGFSRHLRPGFRVEGMKHERRVRLSLNVYALDRFLRTVKERERAAAGQRAAASGLAAYQKYDFAGAWGDWLGPLGVDPSSASDDAMRERAARVRKQILPGHEDALVRDILAEHLSFGPFGPDNHPRKTVSPS